MTALNSAVMAAFRRELAANRLNRFFHVHLAIAFAAGLLPLFTAEEAAGSAPWWLLQAVLYCVSLSALLLGLSSAQAEAAEFPILFSQPAPRWTWLAGKVIALSALLLPAALLLIAPAAVAAGLTRPLLAIAAAAGGVSLALAAIGLALGFWVRDHVRGVLTALAVWFVMLFGTDLVLLAVAGAPWTQGHPSFWVAPLMINPLDALRVTVIFSIGNAAPSGLDSGALAGWWVEHGGPWLVFLLAAWTAGGLAASLAGARRSLDA